MLASYSRPARLLCGPVPQGRHQPPYSDKHLYSLGPCINSCRAATSHHAPSHEPALESRGAAQIRVTSLPLAPLSALVWLLSLSRRTGPLVCARRVVNLHHVAVSLITFPYLSSRFRIFHHVSVSFITLPYLSSRTTGPLVCVRCNHTSHDPNTSAHQWRAILASEAPKPEP